MGVGSLGRVCFFAASWAVFPVATACLVWGWQPQNICCLVYHDREAETSGDTRERISHGCSLNTLNMSNIQCLSVRGSGRIPAFPQHTASWGLWSKSTYSKCLFYESFPFASCKYSFTPCQHLRSQTHEEVINISMERSLWNPEFGIIFASQAQKPPRQACLLIAFNFPLKQCLLLNKRLIEKGSVCQWFILKFCLLFIQECSAHTSPPLRRSFSKKNSSWPLKPAA